LRLRLARALYGRKPLSESGVSPPLSYLGLTAMFLVCSGSSSPYIASLMVLYVDGLVS